MVCEGEIWVAITPHDFAERFLHLALRRLLFHFGHSPHFVEYHFRVFDVACSKRVEEGRTR